MGTTAYPMDTVREKRRAYLDRYSRLVAERSSWFDHWSELGRHIMPRVSRFFTTDRNRGNNKSAYNSILDNTALRARRICSAGLMAGMTPPGRPWIKMMVDDVELRNSHRVQVWLDEVARRMLLVCDRSNTYRGFQRCYDEICGFGVHAQLVLSDFDTIIRHYPLTIGQFCLQQDDKQRITTVYREYQRTVGELKAEFGYERLSQASQQAFENGALETPVKILHVIEPRGDRERNPSSPTAENMPWKSVHMELTGDDDKLLRESGFMRLRLIAPRWDSYGEDVYGSSCPGMEALGDIKQLQHQQLRKGQAIDYMVMPPLQVPQQMKDRHRDRLPGGVSYFEPASIIALDQAHPHGGVRTAFNVDLRLDFMLEDLRDVRVRINEAFHVDTFLMFATGAGDRMTVPEVLERQGEKLLMTGPVVDRVDNEMLRPFVDILFYEMEAVGALPPPPEELVGRKINAVFTGILAQAQRAVGATSTQQWMSEALVVGQTRPDVLDNIDFDAWCRRTAHIRGVDADLLVDERSVEMLRQARAEAEAAAEQTALAQQQAGITKDLAGAPVGQGSALDAIAGASEGA